MKPFDRYTIETNPSSIGHLGRPPFVFFMQPPLANPSWGFALVGFKYDCLPVKF
jgi:hypothetical protein